MTNERGANEGLRGLVANLPRMEAPFGEDTGCDWVPLHLVNSLLAQGGEGPANNQAGESFQQRVRTWTLECFGQTIADDKVERNHRFLEESLELVQALGCTQSEAHQLVDYVFSRPSGNPNQECGGVRVTLAALCNANQMDARTLGEAELERVWKKIDAIRAKQAAKPKYSPLSEPMAAPPAIAPPAENDCTGSQDCKHTCPDIAAIEQAAFEKADEIFKELETWQLNWLNYKGLHTADQHREIVQRGRSLAAGRKEKGEMSTLNFELAKQRVEIVERMMKLPYIKATRDTERGEERFVARDDVIGLIHELSKPAPRHPAATVEK